MARTGGGLMKAIICCGSIFSNHKQLAEFLAQKTSIEDVLVLNRFKNDYLSLDLFSHHHQRYKIDYNSIDFSKYSFVVIENIFRSSDLEYWKTKFPESVVVYFNDSAATLREQALTYMDSGSFRRYFELEYYEYREKHDGCDLAHIVEHADFYINSSHSSKQELFEQFLKFINGEMEEGDLPQIFQRAIKMLAGCQNRTACILLDSCGAPVGKGINRMITDEGANRAIKQQTKAFLSTNGNQSWFEEKELNRIFDFSFGVHAEMVALSDSRFNDDIKIAIVTKKPCINCLKALYYSGVREIYYLYDFLDEYTEIVMNNITDIVLLPYAGSV